jgi:hypothetical protein
MAKKQRIVPHGYDQIELGSLLRSAVEGRGFNLSQPITSFSTDGSIDENVWRAQHIVYHEMEKYTVSVFFRSQAGFLEASLSVHSENGESHSQSFYASGKELRALVRTYIEQCELPESVADKIIAVFDSLKKTTH